MIDTAPTAGADIVNPLTFAHASLKETLLLGMLYFAGVTENDTVASCTISCIERSRTSTGIVTEFILEANSDGRNDSQSIRCDALA